MRRRLKKQRFIFRVNSENPVCSSFFTGLPYVGAEANTKLLSLQKVHTVLYSDIVSFLKTNGGGVLLSGFRGGSGRPVLCPAYYTLWPSILCYILTCVMFLFLAVMTL